jgi:uncharacterized SAM-binding protein YcdF (DUF218 family)
MVRADAIVVLGCRVLATGTPSAAAARRAAAAVAAYRAGFAPRVVASGGRRWGRHAEALVLAATLARAGVPRDAIAAELCSMTTSENAFYSAALLRRAGASRAVVVTCAWHMPRALSSFRAAGLEAFAFASEGPAPGPLAAAYRALHEAIATGLDRASFRRLSRIAPLPFEVAAFDARGPA